MISGYVIPFENKKETIIFFRILQEFISNTARHSKATEFYISLDYTENHLIIKAIDNGQGFEMNEVKVSSGLLNLEDRAKLTESSYILTSQTNGGSQLIIIYLF